MLRSDKYTTLLVMVAGFFLLYLLSGKTSFAVIALIVGVSSAASPAAADFLEDFWQKAGELLGWINSRIILSIVFFFILTPIALISRIFSKDPLQLKRAERKTMFHDRNHTYTAKALEEMW